MSLTVIAVPDTIAHCGNEISCTLETSLPVSTPNLKIVCYLQVEMVYGSGTYTIIGKQILDVDSNGQAQFPSHDLQPTANITYRLAKCCRRNSEVPL